MYQLGWLINKVIEMLKIYKEIFTNKKKLKLIIIGAITLIVVANILVYFKDSYFAGDKSGVYSLGDVTIPTVESIVGDRDFELIFKNKNELRYMYDGAENPINDIEEYTNYLIEEHGYVTAQTDSDYTVMKDDKIGGVIIVIDCIVLGDEYEIHAKRSMD